MFSQNVLGFFLENPRDLEMVEGFIQLCYPLTTLQTVNRRLSLQNVMLSFWVSVADIA